MQKALLLALIFGAFLFSFNSKADDQDAINQLKCSDLGGTFQAHPTLGEICSTPARKGELFSFRFDVRSSDWHSKIDSACTQLSDKYYDYINRQILKNFRVVTPASGSGVVTGSLCVLSGSAVILSNANEPASVIYNGTSSPVQTKDSSYYCPPDDHPKLTSYFEEYGAHNCFAYAPEDVPEEPECDDILGNCTEPDPFECFLTSAGSEVCFADPNDKCDKEIVNEEPVFSNCAAGCGFVNDNFLCADKPDLPSLDDCLVTTNGYACPSDTPPPDDNIDDPTKPLPDMVKNDFKDVLKGVETRQDATNKLLSDQIARDKDNTNKLAGKLDIGNKALKSIEDNTGSAAKSLREGLYGDALEIEDDSGSILSSLGLTGEESITDLEKSTVSLSDYRDQFTWSAGSSSCPAPRSMNILNKTFSIDWQPYCDAFTVIGYLIKAAALFLSGFIAFGVRK